MTRPGPPSPGSSRPRGEAHDVDALLRAAAPGVLAVVARRATNLADAEDAVQEALAAAAVSWPRDGIPDSPAAWLTTVARRRLVGQHRSRTARERREQLAASWSRVEPDPAPAADDSLTLLFLCCHPALSPASAIPLTLRAVGGLTTREIANAFVTSEATMAQRISRAKATIKASPEAFAPPSADSYPARLRSVLHVLYLLFNEGHTASTGPDLDRVDLATEAIRLTRQIRQARPHDPEIAGLLGLMVLTDARRPARTDADGRLVSLATQDRSRWDRSMIREGVALTTVALRQGTWGEYVALAAIAAVHDQAPSYDQTNWNEIAALYRHLEHLSGNPVVTLNRAVATAMVDGPQAGLDLLDTVADRLADHHRYHAVRAQLLERSGQPGAAADEYRLAVDGAGNARERDYLTTQLEALSFDH